MLTIKTTGDDAWDTDARLLKKLCGYSVVINGDYVEIIGVAGGDSGSILVQPLNPDATHKGKELVMDAHNIEIEVL